MKIEINNISKLDLPFEWLRQKLTHLFPLVEFLLARGHQNQSEPLSIFSPGSPTEFEQLGQYLNKMPPSITLETWPLIDGAREGGKFAPIRAFRRPFDDIISPASDFKFFRSSGTTSGTEGRSRSPFSDEGLHFYRAAAIATFIDVLKTRTPNSPDSLTQYECISLVPPVDKWPESSLAQMVDWFSGLWTTHYIDADDPDLIHAKLRLARQKNLPVFVFGTAFHFVNLLDSDAKFQLPPRSFIIETGGTKGRSRTVTRAELYKMISDGFGIHECDIASEYGMCELASQAWDFCKERETSDLKTRTYRFPWWVTVGTMQSVSQLQTTGAGALTVCDPLRIDIGEAFIQTEDLADIQCDHSFRILGRVPRAVLKGCSLNVSELSEQTKIYTSTSRKDGPRLKISASELTDRAASTRKWMQTLISDHVAKTRLEAEFQNTQIAEQALTDLAAGLPQDDSSLIHAALKSIQGDSIARDWLFIPPASHSMACIYPLALASILGLHLRVRLPEIEGISSEQTFLARALDLAKSAGCKFDPLDSNWRLGPNDLFDGEAILIFGDDNTVSFVNHFAPLRVSSFGNAVSICIINGTSELELEQNANGILKDAWSLCQRGCLSSRLVICIGGEPEDLVRRISKFENLLAPDRNHAIAQTTARAIETIRFMGAGFFCNQSLTPKSILFFAKKTTLMQLCHEIPTAMSQLDFILPILILPDQSHLEDVLKVVQNLPYIRAISTSQNFVTQIQNSENNAEILKDLRVVTFGNLNSPNFDGTHLERSFFAIKA